MDNNTETLENEMAVLTESLEIQQHQLSELQLRSETYFHQKDRHHMEKHTSNLRSNSGWSNICEEEIELELIKRKESMKGGQ